MGLFDSVHFSMACPNCGEHLDDFQTKDSRDLNVIEPDGIGKFYSSYRKCKAWVEFIREKPPRAPLRENPLTLDEITAMGFVMNVQLKAVP